MPITIKLKSMPANCIPAEQKHICASSQFRQGVRVPVILIGKHKEALGIRGAQCAQALVDALIAMLDFIQDDAHDDDICDGLMLQKIHLQIAHDGDDLILFTMRYMQ